MDYTKEFGDRELRCISFCTGYRGIELGLSIGGVRHRVITYVEIGAFPCANLVAAMEKGAIYPSPIWTDIKTFPAKEFYGKVDLFTAGYPCQPFSIAGKGQGAEDPRHLWPYLQKHIEAAKPIYCFLENVRGHLRLGYDQVYRELRDLGYKVEQGIFSSKETGAAHERERLFILAKLEYTESQIHKGLYKRKTKEFTKFRKSSSKLENPNYGNASIREEQVPTDKTINSSGQLADNYTKGFQRQREKNAKKKRQKQTGSITQCSRIPIAPPCHFQYPWEEPRQNSKVALKSRLGGATHGYDYRRDFLRALGNGVDPWVAAKAWTVLQEKLTN